MSTLETNLEEDNLIYLNEKDIMRTVDLSGIMDKIEEAYKLFEQNDFHMPPRPYIEYDDKTLIYMPCFIDGYFGTKALTIIPANKAVGKPAIDGVMILNDGTTGEIMAMIDAKTLTALRTGAVGGVAVKYLTPPDIKSLGVIGAGVQGFYQTLYACTTRKINIIELYDIDLKSTEQLAVKLKNELPDDIHINIAGSTDELVQKSQLIITATTAGSPVLPDDADCLRGKHFVGIGSYKHSMREYPDAIFSLVDKVYVDLAYAKEESGDLYFPIKDGLISDDAVEEFSHFLAYEDDKQSIANKTTFFKSVGMALFDVVVSKYIFEKACEKDIGQRIEG